MPLSLAQMAQLEHAVSSWSGTPARLQWVDHATQVFWTEEYTDDDGALQYRSQEGLLGTFISYGTTPEAREVGQVLAPQHRGYLLVDATAAQTRYRGRVYVTDVHNRNRTQHAIRKDGVRGWASLADAYRALVAP